MIGARGREKSCQEASHLSRTIYVPCGRPAVMIVDNGDKHPYWMCEMCANHNVMNRQAVAWVPAPLVNGLLKAVRDMVPYDPREAHVGFGELEDLIGWVRS